MIKREICGELERCAGLLPVVTLLGPRQSGKTTIVRHVFHGYSYANLEDSLVFELARTDSRLFLKQFAPPVIIDEVQRSFARNLRLLRKVIPCVLSADVVYAGQDWPLPPDGRFINFASIGEAVLCGGEKDG